MGKLVAVEFGSKHLQVVRSIEGKVRRCLQDFMQSGSFRDADNLRRMALPESRLYGSRLVSTEHWLVEVVYDNLIHEGEGKTEAAALVDAIQRISEAIKSEPEEPTECHPSLTVGTLRDQSQQSGR